LSGPKIRPSLPLLYRGVGIPLFAAAVALWIVGDLADYMGLIGAVAGLFLLPGAIGSVDETDETPGLARFHKAGRPRAPARGAVQDGP